MTPTIEQIKEILAGTPNWATSYDFNQCGYYDEDGASSISDLRTIIAQHEEIERLRGLLDAAICPCCDKSGAYYDNCGEVNQCQWCYEVNLKGESE